MRKSSSIINLQTFRVMRRKSIFLAAIVVGMTFASCADDDFMGNDPSTKQKSEALVPIEFGSNFKAITRGDIVGNEAANILGNGFYVTGTKGSEGENNPSETLVFDNYLTYFSKNTAGTTESNTANWEYVGVTPGSGDYTKWVKLSALDRQTIKYWDYSTTQYDFLAFSTGGKKAVLKTNLTGSGTDPISDEEIGVTAMEYGTDLASGATAYTFYIPTAAALQNVYITDVITVGKANYGNEVKLTFKNLGSKIRLALYETVPGYSVKDVKFYTSEGLAAPTDLGTGSTTTAALISANATYGFPTKGIAEVSFPNVGTKNNENANYKKASVSVTVPSTPPAEPILSQTFGSLDNYQGPEHEEDNGNYLGRSLPNATYAGNAAVDYYQIVFPVTNSSALTLRVDYTLVSTDGSDEEIKVYGAKAVVPSTYTVWQPNYAYTYIFKISDNTNGWTSQTNTDEKGLFPITFDAVVAEVKEVSGEQRTVTTVSTPSITTYQQKHNKANDEYSKAIGKNVYIQVMDNSSVPATLLTDLNQNAKEATTKKSLFYAVTGATNPTEALVMDALQNQSSVNDVTGVITGRNSVVLTPAAIDLAQTTIVNGVDDKAINLTTAGKVAMINMSSTDAGTYAYVYDYSDAAKTTKTFYQPKTVAVDDVIADGTKYITLEKLATIGATTSSEAANDGFIYFSKTTTDGTHYTYSYYSVDGKTGNLPDGLLKVSKTTDLLTGNGSTTKVVAGDFVFDIYTRNTGKYAVKIIKIEA